MVDQTKILLVELVIIFRQIFFCSIVLFLCINQYTYAAEHRLSQVNRKSYQFWLWPGAKLPPNIDIDRLYLMQGFFSARNHLLRFIDQGQNARRLKHIKELVLVYRLDALQPSSNIIAQFHKDAQSWTQNGNNVIGLQLDFDSATGNIKQYDQFLKEIRRSLDIQYELSITGLMDWVNSPLELSAANEVVLQTYQGKRNVVQLERYLARLIKTQQIIPINFKLGVVQGTILASEITDSLSKNPKYKGQVIFLLQHGR
jgi:hypothetical protein